jgi:2'-5' RNA ligase/DNA polymerase III epsilon subunit-like protein
MKIKKYTEFIKESSGYKYGCVMVEVPVKNWKEITSYIDPEDIYTGGDDTHGIQENPHVTILYGLHDGVTEDEVKSVFEEFTGDINIEVNGIGIFENDKFDVVKFNVNPDGSLQELHNKLSEFPNSNEFPDYKPHITIAYVKKGTGKKYVKPEYKYEVKNVNKITYSMPNGKKVYFDYNINESIEYNDNTYDSEWKLPTSQERLKLERYLDNILLEITDLGYATQISGFVNNLMSFNKSNPLINRSIKSRSPYIWICNKKGRTRIPIVWEEVNDTIESIKTYLESEGFWNHVEVINEGRPTEQIYIHFDKKSEEIKENKMWYKTIPEILEWIESKSKLVWIFLDTETTGLGGPKKQQLTQVSAIATQYDFKSNNFSEISTFDEKIKLTDETKSKFLQPEDKTKWVLGFNHYGSGDYKYKDENDIVNDFFKWIENYSPNILVAQNASFDMAMLSGRYGHKINSEVFDTKMLIQLYFLPLLQTLAETDSKYKEMIDFIGTSSRDNGLISSSMSKIGPVLGVNMMGYHDAITDCRITIQMYQKIIDLLKQNQDVDIMKYQIERIKTLR